MNIKPCPFCGAQAEGPQPVFDSIGYVINHRYSCYLFSNEAIVETRLYRDNPVIIEMWNNRERLPRKAPEAPVRTSEK